MIFWTKDGLKVLFSVWCRNLQK